MVRTFRIDVGDLEQGLAWLVGQWWFYAVVGVVVVLVVVAYALPDAKTKTDPAFPADGVPANELALGLPQIMSEAGAAWNDPTASHFTDRDRAEVVSQWGVETREDWLEAIQRLVVVRRRREVWQIYLAVRADLAARLGRAPSAREWMAGIVDAGGSGAREERRFVTTVHDIEGRVRKEVGREALPRETIVTSFDGYPLGQAVALATWGVALGHGDEAEARSIIHEVNDIARPEFDSWARFGLSYCVGRIMHWTDGEPLDDKSYNRLSKPVAEVKRASRTKLDGPWARLPWNR